MMRGARGLLALGVLVGLCVFFAGGVLSALRPVDIPPPPEAGPSGAPPTAPEIANFAAPDLADLGSALERPPFNQSRRPAAAPAIPSAAPVILNATLNGVILSTEDRVAILSTPDDGEAVRLRIGDVYLGWVLTQIESDQVVLERDGVERRLELAFKAPPKSARELERERRRERARRSARDRRQTDQQPEQPQDQQGEQGETEGQDQTERRQP